MHPASRSGRDPGFPWARQHTVGAVQEAGKAPLGRGAAEAASLLVGGKQRATLKPGDYFGEIALIDEGARLATITALSELKCYGLTYWDFRPLVQENGAIGWKLLQSLAKKLRDAHQGE